MNPLLQSAIASVIRWLLAIGAGWLVKAGVWSEGDAAGYVTAAAVAVTVLVWSIWQKYKSRVKFLTALAAPPGTTEIEVETKIKSKEPTPSITTPKDVVPESTEKK